MTAMEAGVRRWDQLRFTSQHGNTSKAWAYVDGLTLPHRRKRTEILPRDVYEALSCVYTDHEKTIAKMAPISKPTAHQEHKKGGDGKQHAKTKKAAAPSAAADA